MLSDGFLGDISPDFTPHTAGWTDGWTDSPLQLFYIRQIKEHLLLFFANPSLLLVLLFFQTNTTE